MEETPLLLQRKGSVDESIQDYRGLLIEAESHLQEKVELLRAMRVGPHSTHNEVDRFLVRIYFYFAQKGFACLLMEKVVNLLIFLFITGFGIFLLSFVNYSVLFEASTNSTVPFSSSIDVSPSRVHPLVWILATFLMIFWTLNVIQLCRDLPDLFLVRRFYRNILQIQDVTHVSWNQITDLLLSKEILPVGSDALTIAQRILRRENYIIAIINRDLFQLDSRYYRLLYTKPFEWCLNYAIWNYLFDGDMIRPEVLKPHLVLEHAQRLSSRIKVFSIFFFLLSPLILVYLLVYYLFAYFDQIRSAPSFLGGRMWCRYAMWKFREFNELPHFFYSRLSKSREPTEKYLSSFTSSLVPLIARFLSFLVGSFLTVILLISFLSDDILLAVTVWDRSLFYYVGIFGVALTVLRSAAATPAEAQQIPEPQKHLDEVSLHTHHRPTSWENAWDKQVYAEIDSLYLYRILLFLTSMVSVLTSPLIMFFAVSQSSENIIRFVQEFTVHDASLGYICSFSHFSLLDQHVSSLHESKNTRHGKLEKSIVTFTRNCAPSTPLDVSIRSSQVNVPRWNPPASCKELLRNIEQYGSTFMSRLIPGDQSLIGQSLEMESLDATV